MFMNGEFETELTVTVRYNYLEEQQTRDHPGGIELEFYASYNDEALKLTDETERWMQHEVMEHIRGERC